MPIIQTRSHSEDRYTQSESGHRERERDREEKKEKKGFWGTRDNKERERERDRDMGRDRDRRDEESQAELTRMIGTDESDGGRICRLTCGHRIPDCNGFRGLGAGFRSL